MERDKAFHIQFMSLLYTISNVCIPFSLLIFETAKRGSQGAAPSYGKWLVLFVITFIFGGLTVFHSWLITFVDLCLKVGLYFLPEHMNEIIEERIRNLHLEGIIESYRCKFINRLFDGYNHTTHFLLKQLRAEESQQFREALIEGLSNNKSTIQLVIEPKEKLMTNADVQCTLINDKMIDEAKTLFDKKLKYIEKEKEELERTKVELEKKSVLKQRHEAEKEYVPQKAERVGKNKVEVPSALLQTMPVGGFREKKPEKELASSSSIKNLAQSNQFLPEDFEGEEEFEKPVSKLRYSRNTQEKTGVKPVEMQAKKIVRKEKEVEEGPSTLRRSNTTLEGLKINSSNVASRERSYSPDGSSLREQAQILEKLDLSVSEYSDMFDEEENEDENEGEKKLVCKVEAIVEIGSAPNARLEIYNLQLFSNRDLRIVSLYDREFEKHRLVSISKGVNNYYELNLSGTTVTKRRVKFRGQFQAFMKYLQ